MIKINSETHMPAGLLSGLILLSTTNQNDPIIITGTLAVATLVSILPDCDKTNSFPGKIFFPISFIWDKLRNTVNLIQKTNKKSKLLKYLDNVFEHRGLTHTLLFPSLIFIWYGMTNNYLILAGLVGYLSHLVMDLLTKQGIPLLWPLTWKRINIGNVTTGKTGEKVICGMIWMETIIMFLKVLGIDINLNE